MISVAYWLSLGGPAGFRNAYQLPGSKWLTREVWGRYHHWATRFERPLITPAVFGRVLHRFGVSGARTGTARFSVFPDPLNLLPWLGERCPRQWEAVGPPSFDPEKLPWVQGLRVMAAAEPDEPKWAELLEALPERNYVDPLDPFPEWVVPYDAADSGLGLDSSAAGGPPPAPSPSVEGVMSREAAAEALGLDTAAEGLSVFARSTRADWPSS